MILRNGIMPQARNDYLSEYGLATRRNVKFFSKLKPHKETKSTLFLLCRLQYLKFVALHIS